MMRSYRPILVWTLAAATALAALAAVPSRATARRRSSSGDEVQLSSDEFKQLDTFEGHSLNQADQAYGKGDWRNAFAQYEAFILTFPRSQALPYAVFRKARCLHRDEKRFDAIKWYKEVLDYWPNRVKYAAAAKFHIGQCHWENGSEEEAVKTWVEMADDEAYSKHPLAAGAINQIGDYMSRAGEHDRAAVYYRQVALDFRTKNPGAANEAIRKAVEYYVRIKPDEAALRDFYAACGTFDRRGPQKVSAEVGESRDYWNTVIHRVNHHARDFGEDQTELRERYFQYWADALQGRYEADDDVQITLAGWRLAHEKEPAKWMARLDAHFKEHQGKGDFARIVRWIGLYAAHKGKVMEYYNKLQFERMKNPEIERLMTLLYDRVKDAEMGKNCFYKIRLDQLSDDRRAELARYFREKDEDIVKTLCRSMEDEPRGRMELLRFYAGTKRHEDGIPLAAEMAGVPAYSTEALTLKAEMHEAEKQWDQALACWQQINKPPETSWRIANCYFQMKKLGQAIRELRQVESFFPRDAPEACIRIAYFYDKAGQKRESIAVFREVTNKYPESGQSSRAHHELEKRGVTRIEGGVDAE